MKTGPLSICLTRSRSFCAIALLLAATAAPDLLGQTSVTKYSLDQPVTNQEYYKVCTNEVVLMNGTMHFEYFFSVDADGTTVHYHINSNTRLAGVGKISGAKYVGSNSTNYQTITTGSGASDFSSSEKIRLIAQGATPDMMLRQNIHVVVDSRGNIRANADGQTVNCK